jgi:Family of unknown function (DUF5345)
MKKRGDDADMEQAFQELLGGHVEKWDASIEPPPMNEDAFSRMVVERKEELRRKQRSERYLFGLVSAFVLGGMLLLWQSSFVLFAVLQAFVFAAAGIFLIVGFRRSKREDGGRTWPDGN